MEKPPKWTRWRIRTQRKPLEALASSSHSGPIVTGLLATERLIHEHHGLAAVEDHAVLQMIAYRACQHAALDVATLASEIVWRIAVADALDVLIDDRALIEIAGDVMRGGADQLDAALVRLVIRPRALESRQKRVMDIDAAPRKLRRHLVRQDLHIACQHHEV